LIGFYCGLANAINSALTVGSFIKQPKRVLVVINPEWLTPLNSMQKWEALMMIPMPWGLRLEDRNSAISWVRFS